MAENSTFRDELLTLSYRYHIHHPFDKLLQSGRASKEVLALWAANRYYYQDTIPRKDAAIIAKCPDSRLRAMWCQHVITHDVNGALTEWLQLTDALGLERSDVIAGKLLLPATKFACDAYYHFCRDAPWQEGMCASMTHLFAGDIHQKRIHNWPERYPWLPASAFVYFKQRTSTLPAEIDTTLQALSAHFTRTPEALESAKAILRFKQDVLWCMMDALWHHCFAQECRVPLTAPSSSPPATPHVFRILGSGAGGGVPQWNGRDAWNDTVRTRVGESRTQCSAALRLNDADEWLLLNCSPDFRTQWNELLRAHPKARLRGVLFTDAELDHIGGLLSLRESKEPLLFYATEATRAAIVSSGLPRLLETYTTVVWNEDVSELGLPVVTRIASKAPKYAPDHAADVLAVCLPTLVYVPVVPTLDAVRAVRDLATDDETLIVDGTFATANEMPHVKGHLPMDAVRAEMGPEAMRRVAFTRLNHTNHTTPEEEDLTCDGEERGIPPR